jgi:hypothetical protein
MTNFTIDEVLQFIQNELPAHQTAAFQKAFETDLELRSLYENLLSTSALFKKHSLSPDQRSIDCILHYANRVAVAEKY